VLSVLTNALKDGWQLDDFRVGSRRCASFAGQVWGIQCCLGASQGGLLSAIISICPRNPPPPAARSRRSRLPAGSVVEELDRIADELTNLGYRGGWTMDSGGYLAGWFSKDLRGSESLKRELRALRGLRIGEAKPGRT